ncbi:large conductance mechanosensitive channel protein MscL [Streptomyces fuscigenes]|uniref:large conductance mechanosensitive channel protein MscL n=1 Tax=Streptomyces fuscigenes TaxID=1528880 RepID=UPI001F329618|nr:large conductance mechanosensitive channel protein MscL [Streptomyces fuscigenes]MCF3962660.1 large conductance mechanosensitive channel protein MscL [Streptomyces fuscigenes]
MSKEKESVLAGFKAFLMRGNVIDLAVAVVIGAAFTNIVNAVVKGVINPVVGAFGTQDLDKYSYCWEDPCSTAKDGTTHGIEILWGTVLSSALNFLITAAVVYFLMVLPMSRFLARRARIMAAKEQAPVDEVVQDSELEVLKEIRDTLISQRGPSDSGTTVPRSR